jgi:putative hydrolase of the HAD superfamily
MKKALIFDLDDTLYPTKSVAEDMYAELLDLISPHVSAEVLENIREDILTTPFQKVADRYALDKDVKAASLKYCLEMDYDGPMKTFEDYKLAMDNDAEKFLVTAGYTKLQEAKIRQLGIAQDFKEIIIVDPYKSEQTKADVFHQIMIKYKYEPADVLVVGDNPESELALAKNVGLETYLYDYEGKYSPALADYYGTSYDNFNEVLSRS